MMMEKATLLVLCWLVVSLSGSPLDPSSRFGQRDTSILMTSSTDNPAPLQEVSGMPPGEDTELRSGRHADAIFTKSYRKVLGQISARRFLRKIMGKRIRDESESYVKHMS